VEYIATVPCAATKNNVARIAAVNEEFLGFTTHIKLLQGYYTILQCPEYVKERVQKKNDAL